MRSFLVGLLLAASMAVILLLPLGCGDSSTATDVTSVKTEPVEIPVAAPDPVPGATPVEAQEDTSPYGVGSTTPQSVGTLIDGLQLKNIRWSDHGSYYRIVFEMATSDGKPVLQVPHAEASINSSTLRVVLGGIRSISDSPSVTTRENIIGDTMVKSISRTTESDDQALVYEINLSKPTTYSLAGLGSPGRIVIDINKI
ncbi:MAG: hypothetical protein WC828_05870 [Thermoleophilia bacterium]|jgi:hypothetical protein